MSDDVQSEQGEELKTALMKFNGRDVEVKVPTPDQLAIYRRLSKQFRVASDTIGTDGAISADKASHLFEKMFSVITSIVVLPEDVDFIEDEVMAGKATLIDILPVFTTGIEALKEANPQVATKTQVVTS